jgi:hypothetical protein
VQQDLNSASFVTIGYFSFIAEVHGLQSWGLVMWPVILPDCSLWGCMRSAMFGLTV